MYVYIKRNSNDSRMEDFIDKVRQQQLTPRVNPRQNHFLWAFLSAPTALRNSLPAGMGLGLTRLMIE